MSNGNTALALALGAGGGLALWYVLRDDDKKKPAAAPTVAPGSIAPAATSATAPAPAVATTPAGPCALRLAAAGLTADGQPIDIAGAVARCKAAGRADVFIADDAPGTVYMELTTALAAAGVVVTPRRNGAAPRAARRRRQGARRVDLARFARTVVDLAEQIDADPTPEGLARGRFGTRKVFIAAIRRALHGTKYGTLSRAAVDELLVAANREGLLDLARADLPSVMDPAEVGDSEIRHLMSTWHFVVSERPDARNSTAYHHFTLRAYPEGRKAGATLRWFHAEPAITWAGARDRLIAAGIADAETAGRTHLPGGWMLSVDPKDYRDERAEALP